MWHNDILESNTFFKAIEKGREKTPLVFKSDQKTKMKVTFCLNLDNMVFILLSDFRKESNGIFVLIWLFFRQISNFQVANFDVFLTRSKCYVVLSLNSER